MNDLCHTGAFIQHRSFLPFEWAVWFLKANCMFECCMLPNDASYPYCAVQFCYFLYHFLFWPVFFSTWITIYLKAQDLLLGFGLIVSLQQYDFLELDLLRWMSSLHDVAWAMCSRSLTSISLCIPEHVPVSDTLSVLTGSATVRCSLWRTEAVLDRDFQLFSTTLEEINYTFTYSWQLT